MKKEIGKTRIEICRVVNSQSWWFLMILGEPQSWLFHYDNIAKGIIPRAFQYGCRR